MPVIAVVGKKGGIGKTTIALCLADVWHARGFRVAVVDGDDDDDDGSASTWSDVAREAGISSPPVIPMKGTPVREKVINAIKGLAASFDFVLVDTPGALHKRTVYALYASDLALLPCGPSGLDVWKMRRVLAQVREVQQLRPQLDCAIAVTRRQVGTVLGARAAVSLKETNADVLSTELHYRIDYGESITGGYGPHSYNRQGVAAKEVGRLARELEQRCGVKAKRTR